MQSIEDAESGTLIPFDPTAWTSRSPRVPGRTTNTGWHSIPRQLNA